MIQERNSQKKQKESVKSYFNKTSNDYTQTYDTQNADSIRAYIFLTRKENVLNMVNQYGGRVLDIGCGPAVFTEELLKKGCEVWGVDISEDMIKIAQRKMKEKGISEKCHFRVGDIEKLNFPDKYFDFILCVGVLEYLKNDSLALKEIQRVLKDNGRVIITVPNMASPFALIDKLIFITAKAFLKTLFKILTICRINFEMPHNRLLFRSDIKDKYYLPWKFNKQLSNYGFKIDKSIFHVYRLAALNSIAPRLSLHMSKKLEILLKSPFRWTGINYIVKAKKV